MENYFIFKGIDSREMGIKCSPAPVVSPERNMSMARVLGRDGYILLDTNTYAPVYKTLECRIYSRDNLRTLTGWLTGQGKLIFSTEPELYQSAFVYKGISIGYILEDYRAFKVTFACQPFKYSVNEAADAVLAEKSPLSFYGKGNVGAAPVITLWGNGTITLIVNGEQITLRNVSGQARIDAAMQNVYNPVSLSNMSMNMTGEFPFLRGAGELNSLSFTNAGKIEIAPNWRYI